MSIVFIGGSRNISHLSDQVKSRLDNIINIKANIVVGDADFRKSLSNRATPDEIRVIK